MHHLDADQFAAYLAMRGMADASIRNYRAMFVRWTDWAIAHDRDPGRPDPLAVRAWASTLAPGRSTIAQARAMMRHLCAAAGWDDVSPVIPVPRQQRQRTYKGLEHREAVALYREALASGLKGTAVLVGLLTAARRSEIANVAWSRIDLDGRTITLVRPKTRDRLTVPLHPHLHAHLAERKVAGERWLFPGRHGGHVSPATVWQWIRDVAESAGIGKVNSHQLRHTALSEINDATEDLRAAQEIAGHEDPSITAGYTRVSDARMRAAIEALDYTA